MDMRAFVAFAAIFAASPAIAAAAEDSPRPARAFGNVPTNVALSPPPAGRPGGWGANGWQRGSGMAGHPGLPPRPGVGPGERNGGDHFQSGRWRGDRTGYRRPFVGYVLPPIWYSPNWQINDWAGWGLSAPGDGYGWYRYYDDAVLADGRGSVRAYRSGIDWDRRGGGNALARAYDEGYDDGYDDGHDDGVDYAEDAVAYRGRWAHGPAYGSYSRLPTAYPGGVRVETYRSGRAHSIRSSAQVYGGPNGATVVVIQSAPPVVTKTVSYEVIRVAPAKKHVRPARWNGKMLRRKTY